MDELRELRKKYNYSNNDMAEKLNISKAYYWQIENEERRMSYEMAVKIAKIFKKKPDAIFYNRYKNKD